MNRPQGLRFALWVIIPPKHVLETGTSDPGVPELDQQVAGVSLSRGYFRRLVSY